jgi:hypothetical protein
LYSSIENPSSVAYKEMYDTIEREHKKTASKYNADVIKLFSDMRDILETSMIGPPYVGYLGELSESLKLYPKSLPMEDLDGDVESCFSEKGLLKVGDPCCGSGKRTIALINVLHRCGIVYADKIYMESWDVRHTCARMAYINLTLLGISARVLWGDLITGKIKRAYDTPRLQAAINSGWRPPGKPGDWCYF